MSPSTLGLAVAALVLVAATAGAGTGPARADSTCPDLRFVIPAPGFFYYVKDNSIVLSQQVGGPVATIISSPAAVPYRIHYCGVAGRGLRLHLNLFPLDVLLDHGFGIDCAAHGDIQGVFTWEASRGFVGHGYVEVDALDCASSSLLWDTVEIGAFLAF